MATVEQIPARVRTCLDIAFNIFSQGKNGSYWLNKATTEWVECCGSELVPEQIRLQVVAMVASDYPVLYEKFSSKLIQWGRD